jgi:hypothetical protein
MTKSLCSILALLLSIAFASQGSFAADKVSWPCSVACRVPFSYVMANKYKLLNKELILVGWAGRIGARLYLYQSRDDAIAGIYQESIHLVPGQGVAKELANFSITPVEVVGKIIADKRPISDAWMRFEVSEITGSQIMLNRMPPHPDEYEGLQDSTDMD